MAANPDQKARTSLDTSSPLTNAIPGRRFRDAMHSVQDHKQRSGAAQKIAESGQRRTAATKSPTTHPVDDAGKNAQSEPAARATNLPSSGKQRQEATTTRDPENNSAEKAASRNDLDSDTVDLLDENMATAEGNPLAAPTEVTTTAIDSQQPGASPDGSEVAMEAREETPGEAAINQPGVATPEGDTDDPFPAGRPDSTVATAHRHTDTLTGKSGDDPRYDAPLRAATSDHQALQQAIARQVGERKERRSDATQIDPILLDPQQQGTETDPDSVSGFLPLQTLPGVKTSAANDDTRLRELTGATLHGAASSGSAMSADSGLQAGQEKRMQLHIRNMVQQGGGQMTLQLNPVELGQLEIRVRVEQQRAHLGFNSPHSHVRELIDTQLPALRQAFLNDGIELGKVDVEAWTTGWQQTGGEHRQQQDTGDESAQQRSGRVQVRDGEESSVPESRLIHFTARGEIDYFV